MTTEQEKELLLSFTVLNKEYQNPAFRFPLGVRDGRIGGYNIDSADLTAETLRQYKRGVSLKRGARAAHITPGNAGV
jgi:hypothetical protein